MSESRISRRALVGAGLVLAAGSAGALHVLDSSKTKDKERSKRAAELSALPGRTFEKDYEAMRALILAAFPFLLIPRETMDDFLEAMSQAKRRPRREEQIKELFLLSTDFFAYEADESRPLEFNALYDPYLNPCYNPMEAV